MASKRPVRRPRVKRAGYTQPEEVKKENSNSFSFKKVVDFFKDDKTLFIAGLLIGLFVIFTLFSFISYFFTGAADKSIFDNISFRESLSYRRETKNWASVIGAYLSETLIDNLFGIGSFAILFFLGIVALRLMNVKTFSLWKSFWHAFFWLMWLSVTLGYLTYLSSGIQNSSFFSLGGQHGNYVSEKIFVEYVGNIGMILTIIISFIIYMVLSSSKTIPFILNLFKKKEKINSEEQSSENKEKNEDMVAIGTEIVPEEWVTKPITEEVEIQEEKPTTNNNKKSKEETNKEVDFEVTKPTSEETISNNANPTVEQLEKYDPTDDLSSFEFPTLNLLKSYETDGDLEVDMEEQKLNKEKIITTLRNFGIEIKSIKATVGPTITLYEIVPQSGIRISKIRNLESDIMLSLAATGIRIIAPIPGKGTIGIEVPNNDPQIVSMRSVLSSKKFAESKYSLPVAFGKTITNEVFMVDLAKMPHLLVAGATGQGKSVGLNAIITSLLYKKHPAELKFVLIDPKKVEFNIYEILEKHFLAKLPDGEDAIITDTSKVVETLNSLTAEMDDRYDLLKKAHVRNLREYNEKFINRKLNPNNGHKYLPYIVVVVDEFGDLIMTAGKEVEMPIARIAQLARAVGIHMILATQRPSVNIITGVIKANFPARVAFRVSSMIDSRTILDGPGANQLVGRGDMLFSQGSDLVRVQCAFVDTPEVEEITKFIGTQRGYPTAFYLPEPRIVEGEGVKASDVDMSKRDPLFEEVAKLVVTSQQGSTSMIQRKFSIGYNRAGRVMDQLEVAGVVGAAEGSKPRQVLIQTEYDLEMLLNNLQ